ncbi:MAG: hypothetical protein KJ597_00595 [Nanoarchaeota archaeon]|nr:hypothetical protein [Nanoarchaeota archaeon]MBU1622051.1 hypothetical protein [Nanoarchaeota archaeon]
MNLLIKQNVTETRIIKEVDYFEFRLLIDKSKGKIKVNPHAYFRLSEMQRKVYKDETLLEMLTEEKPAFIGVQKNKNYATFFSQKQGYLRLIFKVTKENIEIVTFYITDNIPKI